MNSGGFGTLQLGRWSGSPNNTFSAVAAAPDSAGTNLYGSSANQWVHVAATMSTTGFVNLYANGINVGSGTLNAGSNFTSSSVFASAGILEAGANNLIGNMNGLMDDLRVYNRELTVGDIGQLVAVPEPASLTLVSVVAGALGWRRMRKSRTTNTK